MPSPSKPSDFSNLVLTSSATLCDRFKAVLLTLPSKLYNFINYILDTDGNPSKAFTKDLLSSTGIWSIGDVKANMSTNNSDGWLEANGQSVSRVTYSDLFSLIGTDHGSGDGSTTFNLPDLRAHVLIGSNPAEDQSTGYSAYPLGSSVGTESVKMTESMIAPHNHVNPEYHGLKIWHDNQQSPTGQDRRDHFGDGRSDAGVSYFEEMFSEAGGDSDGEPELIPVVQPGIAVRFLIYSGVHSSDN